jgi:hypothetical protein
MTTKPNKLPIKKISEADQRARELARDYSQEQEIETARRIGYRKGLADGIRHERRMKSAYRAQGAFFGACLAGIIIIIIATLV